MTKLRFAIAVLIILFVVTVVQPNIILLMMFWAPGLGFPLLLLNTALLYVLVALPFMFVLRQRTLRWQRLVLAAALVPLVGFGAPILSQMVAASRMQATSHDVAGRLAERPRTVELVSLPGPYDRPADSFTGAPCEPLCQRLLLSGQVERVRVVRWKPGDSKVIGRFDYRIEKRATCPDVFPANDRAMLPATKDLLAAGTCFIGEAPRNDQMAARVALHTRSFPDPRNLLEDFSAFAGHLKEIQTLTASATAEGEREVLRQTQVRYTHWALPLHLWYAPCRGLCLGRTIVGRTEGVANKFDPDDVALHALRIDAQQQDEPLSYAARVAMMLDNAGPALSENQMQLIRDWALRSCRPKDCPPFSNADVALLVRLVKDRRVTNFDYVGMVMNRSGKAVLPKYLDLFLDEMEGRGANSAAGTVLGVHVARVAPADLLPHRERILALIHASDWERTRSIGIVAGQLGIDTSSLIIERLGSSSSDTQRTAIIAACRADEAVGNRLAPHLLAFLRSAPTGGMQTQAIFRTAVMALARFGHFDEASAIFLTRFPPYDPTGLQRAAEKARSDINVCFWA